MWAHTLSIIRRLRKEDLATGGRAAQEIRRAIELDPNFLLSYWNLGLVLQEQGDADAAIQSFEEAVRLSREGSFYLGGLGHAYGRAKRKEESIGVLNKLLKLSEARYISPFDIAVVHLGLGDHDAALEWLEQAYGQRVTRLRSLRDAYFDVLRPDARFLDLMRRVGLPAD